MQVAGYQMPDQNKAADFLEKILSRKCKIHRQFSCEYLHLKPSELSPRLCCQCMEERDIPLNEAISIKLLLLATSDTTFKSYPKFSDSSITQKIQNLKGSEDRISTDLSSFFNSLHSAVSQAIEKQKNSQKQMLANLSNSYQGIFNSLSQISKIEQFQEIVKNTTDNEEKLKGFIQAQYSSMNNYTQIINNKVLEYQMIQKSFCLTDANNKLSDIIRLIEGITLFPIIVNNQQQSQQPLQQQLNQEQQSVQQQQQPICLPPQQQQQQLQKQQQKSQNNLRENTQRVSQQQKPQTQPSSSKSVYDYFMSLLKECKEKKIDDSDLYLLSLYSSDLSYLYSDYYYSDDLSDLYPYERWQELSEDKRQRVLSYLKGKLNITY